MAYRKQSHRRKCCWKGKKHDIDGMANICSAGSSSAAVHISIQCFGDIGLASPARAVEQAVGQTHPVAVKAGEHDVKKKANENIHLIVRK